MRPGRTFLEVKSLVKPALKEGSGTLVARPAYQEEPEGPLRPPAEISLQVCVFQSRRRR